MACFLVFSALFFLEQVLDFLKSVPRNYVCFFVYSFLKKNKKSSLAIVDKRASLKV